MFAKARQAIKKLAALYRLLSVIQIDARDGIVGITVQGDVMLRVDGHQAVWVEGHSIRQAALMSDQPGLTREQFTAPSLVVAANQQAIASHQPLALGDTLDLQRPESVCIRDQR